MDGTTPVQLEWLAETTFQLGSCDILRCHEEELRSFQPGDPIANFTWMLSSWKCQTLSGVPTSVLE